MNEKTTITARMIDEEIPFLVAGESAWINTMVVGFPYFYKKKKKGKYHFVPCIIIPNTVGTVEEKNVLLSWLYKPYYIFFRKREFHPVKGKLHKLIRKEDDALVFEDNIRIKI